jgi:SAM-dependent methyltransferase
MSEGGPTDWEAHYTSGDLPWDKGAPSPALLEALERVMMRGRVLVPGCGLGHDVRALAAAGAEVVGLDISTSAVAAAERAPKVGSERYVCGDLFALPAEFAGAFDWVWEHTCFCAIDPARRAEYVRACAQALRPGGDFLGVFYVDPGQALATEGPPFETRLADLDRLFEGRFELREEWCPRRAYPGREGREWVRRYRVR